MGCTDMELCHAGNHFAEPKLPPYRPDNIGNGCCRFHRFKLDQRIYQRNARIPSLRILQPGSRNVTLQLRCWNMLRKEEPEVFDIGTRGYTAGFFISMASTPRCIAPPRCDGRPNEAVELPTSSSNAQSPPQLRKHRRNHRVHLC